MLNQARGAGKAALPLKDAGSIVTECNLEEAEAIQPSEQQGDFLKKAPSDSGSKYPGADLEVKTANDNGDSAFADPFDLSDLLWGGQCQSQEVADGFWNEGNVSAGIDIEQLRDTPTPVNDNDTGNGTPNGAEEVATLSAERELYLHRRASTKVSTRGSFPRVGVEEGNRRLARRQTVCAFDPEATTFSPMMAMYWPAKRERSARTKKSNSMLEAFFLRRLGIPFLPFKIYITRPYLVRQHETEEKVL